MFAFVSDSYLRNLCPKYSPCASEMINKTKILTVLPDSSVPFLSNTTWLKSTCVSLSVICLNVSTSPWNLHVFWTCFILTKLLVLLISAGVYAAQSRLYNRQIILLYGKSTEKDQYQALICGQPRVLSTVSGEINDIMEHLKNITVTASNLRIWGESWFLLQRYRYPTSGVLLLWDILLFSIVEDLVAVLLLSS